MPGRPPWSTGADHCVGVDVHDVLFFLLTAGVFALLFLIAKGAERL
jgi:hypothetical protein